MLVQDVLADEGYLIEVGAPDALCGDTLAAIQPDLLLVDVSRVASGATLQLLEQLRHEVAAGLPPVVITSTDPHCVQSLSPAWQLLHAAAVLKPFCLDTLIGAVQRAFVAPPRAA